METDFSYETPSFFLSMEDTRKLFIHRRMLRHAFVTQMQTFLKRAVALRGRGLLLGLRTDTPPGQILVSFLRSWP